MDDYETERIPKKEQQDLEDTLMTTKIIKFTLIAVLCIFGVILAFNSVYIVNAGERAILITLGNPSDATLTEGLHFKLPIVQSIALMDIKTQKNEVEASAASKDLQTVNTKIAVNYRVDSSSAPSIYKEIGVNYVDRILSPAIQESIKASTAQFTAEELITKREQVRDAIQTILREKMSERGLVIEDVLIIDFDFSKSFNDAIEDKVTAEQNALKELNQLKAVEYQAQQRITQAKGEAEAIKIQAQAITSQGGKEYVQLQAIAKWNGQMPQVTGGALPFINLVLN